MKFYNAHNYVNQVVTKKTPTMRYNGEDSYLEWQKKARQKLGELIGMSTFQRCENLFEIVFLVICSYRQVRSRHFRVLFVCRDIVPESTFL